MVEKSDNDALEAQFESQFQKPGDLVERDDDTGLMQVESLCMNCHKNVRCLSRSQPVSPANLCRELPAFC